MPRYLATSRADGGNGKILARIILDGSPYKLTVRKGVIITGRTEAIQDRIMKDFKSIDVM